MDEQEERERFDKLLDRIYQSVEFGDLDAFNELARGFHALQAALAAERERGYQAYATVFTAYYQAFYRVGGCVFCGSKTEHDAGCIIRTIPAEARDRFTGELQA